MYALVSVCFLVVFNIIIFILWFFLLYNLDNLEPFLIHIGILAEAMSLQNFLLNLVKFIRWYFSNWAQKCFDMPWSCFCNRKMCLTKIDMFKLPIWGNPSRHILNKHCHFLTTTGSCLVCKSWDLATLHRPLQWIVLLLYYVPL